jgi:hypothetical protein
MSIKEELYDVPTDSKKQSIFTKDFFLETLSKYYDKPITVKDLGENDKEILNKIIDDERIYKQTQEHLKTKVKPVTPTYEKKRSRQHETFVQTKKSHKTIVKPVTPTYEKKRSRQHETFVQNKKSRKTYVDKPLFSSSKKTRKSKFKTYKNKSKPLKTYRNKSKPHGTSSSLANKLSKIAIDTDSDSL